MVGEPQGPDFSPFCSICIPQGRVVPGVCVGKKGGDGRVSGCLGDGELAWAPMNRERSPGREGSVPQWGQRCPGSQGWGGTLSPAKMVVWDAGPVQARSGVLAALLWQGLTEPCVREEPGLGLPLPET